jgi:Transposase
MISFHIIPIGESVHEPIGCELYQALEYAMSIDEDACRKIMEQFQFDKTALAETIFAIFPAVIAEENEDMSFVLLMVLNPKASHNFVKVLMKNSKTDAVDAHTLAEYAARMDFVAWTRPSDETLNLRSFARRINALTGQKAAAKNHLHALTRLFLPIPSKR